MPPTLRQRKRLPKPKDIAMMMRALTAAVPFHTMPVHGIRESLKGVVNYRVQSQSFEIDWMVDIYHGDFFVVTAHNYTQPCPSVPSAIGHLRRMLGLKR
jgi:hypothetical protein